MAKLSRCDGGGDAKPDDSGWSSKCPAPLMTLADDARGPIGWRAASCFRYRATAAVPLLGRSPRFRYCGPLPRVRYCAPIVFPIPDGRPRFRYWIVDRVFDAMPQRGIAYQPRVQTLGSPPGKRDPRSEGTPHSRVSRISTPAFPMRCSFRTHLFFRMRFPGRCPGLVCDAPSGHIGR